jgi:putative oxidoreductase
VAQFMDSFKSQAYALLRIVAGFLFLWHGSQKLFSYPLEAMEGMPAFITYGAGGIELFGGALVMVGLLTRWSALICSGTMAIGAWSLELG